MNFFYEFDGKFSPTGGLLKLLQFLDVVGVNWVFENFVKYLIDFVLIENRIPI